MILLAVVLIVVLAFCLWWAEQPEPEEYDA
jgi:hypothetical protein